MENYKYKETYYIRTNDLGFNRKITPMAIQTYLEEAATKHALAVGCGYDDSWSNGYFWVLRSIEYKIYRIPNEYQLVDVITYPVGLDRAKALRIYELYHNGELIGKAKGIWLMIDIKTRRPIVAEHYQTIIGKLDIPKDEMFKLPKIKMPKDMVFSYKKTIRQRDIDWNGHLNNVRYMDLIYNAIPYETLMEKSIKELQLDYLKESIYLSELKVYSKMVDQTIYIKGMIEEEVSFNAKIILE